MARKKASEITHISSDDEVVGVGHPCRYSEVEMRTPRARRASPSEPRTPSKSPSKTFCLDSPLVTPKLDKRKTKHRSSSCPVVVEDEAKPDGEHSAKDSYLSPGFTKEELEASARAVRKGNSKLRWCSAEADDDEQLLRRFDLEPMYGPSVGLSREERWKRASAMGLCPPAEVLQALQANPQSSKSVFDQRLNSDEPPAF